MSEAAAAGSPAGEPKSTHHGPHLNASVVVIVVILSVVLILSGLLHLLARCLGRRRATRVARVPVREQSPLVSALHGQLQQLFHMHDAGVEQAFIDTLPVFAYGSIRGLKDSTDCAVCLTEFGDDDRLRLLPKCKHAFHLECIDTWLLSNSTCPLCRRSLLPDPLGDQPSTSNATLLSSPPSSRRIVSHQNSLRICAAPSSDSDESEIQEIEEVQTTPSIETPSPFAPTIRVMDAHGAPRVLKVELGRVAGSESRKLTSKGARSYSMGSYEYVVNPASWELAPHPPSNPGHRSALSDSIPELGVDNELFWASRGLYNPQTLSKIRELLTPIESEGFSPFVDSGYSPGWIDIDIEHGEIVEETPVVQSASDIKVRSSSLSRLPAEPTVVDTSCLRRSHSAGMIKNETLKLEATVANATSSIFDETLTQQGSLSRRFSLHWLMGRDKRMVFAAPISI